MRVSVGKVGRGLASVGMVVLLSGMLLGSFTAVASATSNLKYDPQLSLTGGCSTSELDPVPDPSCPIGPLPPSGPFSFPRSVATDSYGDIYVASDGPTEEEGRIDVFGSDGKFITELEDNAIPMTMAVDSVGTLYVGNYTSGQKLVRFTPSAYDPANREIEYANPPVVVQGMAGSNFLGMAVDQANDELFVNEKNRIVHFSSAATGNAVLESEVTPLTTNFGIGLAVDHTRGRLYANADGPVPYSSNPGPIVEVFELAPPHNLVQVFDGANTPAGRFVNDLLSIGVNEESGTVFIYDAEVARLYEFAADGSYLGTLEHGMQFVFGAQIAVDNGAHSPNGALNTEGGHYVYVPSHPTGIGHSFAFGPLVPCVPTIESSGFAEVAETDAELVARVFPCHAETTYTFEYTTQAQFGAEGFANASVAGDGKIGAESSATDVAAAATGLVPDTEYRFRIVASNEEGSAEEEGSFRTYPIIQSSSSCPNESLRIGLSARLPDCRAYELVTPADTNFRAPVGLGAGGTFFTTQETSPGGDRVSFRIKGGALPGLGGTGSYQGDPYLARRTDGGWSSTYLGPTGAEAPEILPGSMAPDQEYSFWDNAGGGSTALGGQPTYVRYPDGHSALAGRGTAGNDINAAGRLISEGGGHIIFGSAAQLESNAPESGTYAIYDRTSNEMTHVVSLLPHDETPQPGESAVYAGASLDGRGAAFTIGGILYLRYDNTATYEVGEDVTFAGVVEGGAQVFYLQNGDLYRLDVRSETVTPFSVSGDVTPVNISYDGSTAYYVSPSKLVEGVNGNGAEPQEGQENLYRSQAGSMSFVGAVTHRDVVGEEANSQPVDGLGLWTKLVGPELGPPGRLAADPSRINLDGGALLFQSRADLTSYHAGGHVEVYRYDGRSGTVSCLSCNPTSAVATSDATLQPLDPERGSLDPRNLYVLVHNLQAGGKRAFFQSSEPLVSADTDRVEDVYEWEEAGTGSCTHAGGCLYLVSSGRSKSGNIIYAVSDGGKDIFFTSSDMLLRSDVDETPSIYDARVEGGFAEAAEHSCEGEGCRPALQPPPALSTPGSSQARGSGNVSPVKRCPKGKHRARRNGRVRCVKRHHRHRHKRSATRRAAR